MTLGKCLVQTATPIYSQIRDQVPYEIETSTAATDQVDINLYGEYCATQKMSKVTALHSHLYTVTKWTVKSHSSELSGTIETR